MAFDYVYRYAPSFGQTLTFRCTSWKEPRSKRQIEQEKKEAAARQEYLAKMQELQRRAEAERRWRESLPQPTKMDKLIQSA